MCTEHKAYHPVQFFFDVEMVKGFDVATGSAQIMTATIVGLVKVHKQRMVTTKAIIANKSIVYQL